MKNPTTLLITNPKASRVTSATRDLIAHALASVTKLQTAETTHARHAWSLAENAASAGVQLIVAVGGDGTVNEVANGILASGNQTTALGVVPSGGADVFARTIGIPHDTVEAADALVRFLDASMEPTSRSVGFLDDRAFLFNAGIGFDAAIVEAVDKHPKRKRRYGEFYFVMQGFKLFGFTYPKKTAVVELQAETIEGAPFTAHGRMAVLGLSDPYTFLGNRGFRLLPGADSERGLTAFLLQEMPVFRTLRTLARAFPGKHAHIRGVVLSEPLAKATIKCEPELAMQVDGELIGRSAKASLRWEPNALKVCVPSKLLS
jgi:diacylglycerol kinase family enzyme